MVTYIQSDGVAMGSPLDPVLARIFMVELERTLLPTLSNYMTPWSRYVDDTLAFIREDAIKHVFQKLNNFHANINFMYELESDGSIPFLDVLIMKKHDKLETTVYRKNTNTDLYLHWDAFAPRTWKIGTIRTLMQRAYKVCSKQPYVKKR